MYKVIKIKDFIKFQPDKITREMVGETPEMRVALMCLEPGQKLTPHKAPMQLIMYCVEGSGTFSVGDDKIDAEAMTAVMCDPMVPHGFSADKGERFVVMAVVTPAETED